MCSFWLLTAVVPQVVRPIRAQKSLDPDRGGPAEAAATDALVLIANHDGVIVYLHRNGVTRVVSSIKGGSPGNTGQRPLGKNNQTAKALAHDLIALVEHFVAGRSYDGVFLLADASVHAELCRAGKGRLSGMLVTHIADESLACPDVMPDVTEEKRAA